MAINTTALTTAQRLVRFSGEIIKFTAMQEMLAKAGRQVPMPKNKGKTYTARTVIPYGAGSTASTRNIRFPPTVAAGVQSTTERDLDVINAHRSVDGVSSASDTVQFLDYSAQIQMFECSYSWSREVEDFYEDDVPQFAKDLVIDRVSYVNEMVIYNRLRSCLNRFYGGTGTTIPTVNGEVTLGLLRKIKQSLGKNSAKPVSKLLKAGPNILTTPVAPAYVIYAPTEVESDFRLLSGTGTNGFWPVESYSKPEDALPGEIGKIEGFRIVTSPFFPTLTDAGAAVGSTNCVSTSGTYIDVLPLIIMGQDAFCQIALRGMDAVDSTFIPANQKTKGDIHGKRGYAGAYWAKQALIENDFWMAVAYVGNRVLT